jgi:hypothetical protein
VFENDEKSYGPDYQNHLLEQYKLYVEMADHVSARRATANTFFLTASTVFLSIIGLLIGRAFTATNPFEIITAFAVTGGSVAFSLAWWLALNSYDQLNTGKFKVIHQLEEKLPAALFDAEWVVLGGGKDRKKYWPLSHVEKILPKAFVLMYMTFLVVWVLVILGIIH